MFKFTITNLNKRKLICSAVPGAILAICHRIGAEFSMAGHINFKSMSLYFTTMILSLIFTCMIAIVIYYKENILSMLENIKIFKRVNKIFKFNRSYWIIFILIIIMWIPAFLAVFPGIYSYDAGPQVLQIFGRMGLNAHHPLIHTFLLDGCLYLGKLIANDYNIGLMIYTIIQMLIMASIFSYAINIIKKYNLPSWIQLCALLFFGLSPINQIWVLLTTKDTIFAGFLLLLLVEIIDMLIYTTEFFTSRKRTIRFSIIAILMCLFRNQGIYVFLLVIPFLIFVLKKYRKKAVIMMIIPVVIVKIITGPITSYFNIVPSNPREALSVPIQQIARVLTLKPDSVSPEEKEIIYKYIPEENIKQYIPITSDTVKEGFNVKNFKEDPIPFFKVWLSILIKEPTIYIDSFLYGSYGYFYTDTSPYWMTFILFDGAWLTDGYNILGIERNSLFPQYENYLRNVSVNLLHERVPILSTLLNQAFPFWLSMFVLAFILYQKKYRLLIPLLVVIGFWGTMLLGPLIAIRYAFPIIVCIPTIFTLIFVDDKSKFTLYKKEMEKIKGYEK